MGTFRLTNVRRHLLVLAAIMLVAAACGSSGDDVTEGSSDGGDEERVVRLAGAPDETIDYLTDTGRLAEIEQEWGVTLDMTESWDEFAFFSGGHGDVVSTASYELPLLEQETGIPTVTFGKYSRAKLQVLVRGDSSYQTMADLEGQPILAGSPIGTTLMWGAFTKQLHDLDFKFEGVMGTPAGDDFETILGEHATNPELVVRGDAEA